MLLIADSGSTKCDWRLIGRDKSSADFSTMGINPFFHNEEVIEKELRDNTELAAYAKDVRAIFFYAAGCSSPGLKKIVEEGLLRVFPDAQIYVDHDLVAAALATYNDEPCISCILGTGSNSCHFDGDIVRKEVPSLGYVLGDEGSGSFFGKKLLADFFYKRLPPNLSNALKEEYSLTKEMVLEQIYRKPHANVYLASYMPFITKYKEDLYIQQMLEKGISDFINVHVKCFRDYAEIKTHFIGSIAFFHEELLRRVASGLGVQVGEVIKKPIDGLVDYHIKNHFAKISF